ncbi:MAG: hypothetical protein PUG54_08590 [Firmicutes bacterium]|nr:hypothetical protein [Bacillota bacterium]
MDRLAGTTNYCLGFTFNNGYYMPSSCLLEDIRKLGNNPSRILAILSKKNESTEMVYNTIRYVAKGVPLNKLELPDKLKMIIDLKDYREK